MSSTEMFERGRETERELGSHLYEALTSAVANALPALRGFDAPTYMWLCASHVRAHMRKALENVSLPEAWMLGGNPQLMGQILLNNTVTGDQIRFLKERRSYPGGAPVAGRNRARQNYYTANAQEALPIFGSTRPDSLELKSLLLWDFLDPDELDLGVSMRLVATNEVGQYGQALPLIFSIDIRPDTAIDFSDLAFVGDDQRIDLFETKIDERLDKDSVG